MRILLLLLPILVIGIISPVYAQSIFEGNPIKNTNFFEDIRFFFEDRWIEINERLGNDTARQAIAENERKAIINELGDGVAVAQERIDRVRDRLGEQAVVTLVEANRINVLHEEYLRIKQIDDSDDRLRQAQVLQDDIDGIWDRADSEGATGLAKVYVMDGIFDIYNSTHFPHNMRIGHNDVLYPILYQSGTSSTDPANTFTPTGATQNDVTFMVLFNDGIVSSESALRIKSLKIDGVEKFYFATTEISTTLQTDYPKVDYQPTAGDNSDWGWVNAIFRPRTPILSGMESGNTGILNWTPLTDTFTPEPIGYTVWKQCNVDSEFTKIISATNLNNTHTDNEFKQVESAPFWVETPDFEDDFSTDKGWATTDATCELGTDGGHAVNLVTQELDFCFDLDGGTDVIAKDIGTVSDTWTLRFELTQTSKGFEGNNHGFFGISATDATNVGTGPTDFVGFKIRGTNGGNVIQPNSFLFQSNTS